MYAGEHSSSATISDAQEAGTGGATSAQALDTASPPSNRSVQYDVEVIRQEMNPICWIASCAMVKGYGNQTSIGVGEFTGGFDPSNSSILNLAKNWAQCFDYMDRWGFNTFLLNDLSSGASLTGEDLFNTLQGKGPCLLAHLCQGFPYGSQYGVLNFAPSDAHAVVLTGVDLDSGNATFNNPWGDKDQSCSLSTLVAKINSDSGQGKLFSCWPS